MKSNTNTGSGLQSTAAEYQKAIVELATARAVPNAPADWVDQRLRHIVQKYPQYAARVFHDFRAVLETEADDELKKAGVTHTGLLKRFMAQLTTTRPLIVIEYAERGRSGPDGYSQLNAEQFFHMAEIGVRYNEFSLEYELSGLKAYNRLDDRALVVIQKGMSATGLRVAKEFLSGALEAVGQRNRYHPVRDYLDSLEWDGVPRVDDLFVKYAGAENTALNRAFAACFMIGAARRIYAPGTKLDTIPIMESGQGLGKSTFTRVLAVKDEWYTDNLPIGVEAKEVIELTKGKWIVELPELRGLGKRDVNSVKAFASKQEDEARMAYDRQTTKRPRQFACIGTTNGGKDRGAYLVDDTGNRRFWPIEIKGNVDRDGRREIDDDLLRQDLNQLWAEAVVRHKAGESHILPRALWESAAAEQEKRRATSGVEDALRSAIEDIDGGYVADADLFAAVGLGNENAARRTQVHKDAIKSVMEAAGWTHKQGRIGGKQKRGWFKGASKDILRYSPEDKRFTRDAQLAPVTLDAEITE